MHVWVPPSHHGRVFTSQQLKIQNKESWDLKERVWPQISTGRCEICTDSQRMCVRPLEKKEISWCFQKPTAHLSSFSLVHNQIIHNFSMRSYRLVTTCVNTHTHMRKCTHTVCFKALLKLLSLLSSHTHLNTLPFIVTMTNTHVLSTKTKKNFTHFHLFSFISPKGKYT